MRNITPMEINEVKQKAKEKDLSLVIRNGIWVIDANQCNGQATEPYEVFRGDIVSAIIFIISYKN